MLFTNANAAADNTDFTNDITKLLDDRFIEWDKVFSKSWNNYGNPDYTLKQIMMAEVLVKKHINSKYIKIIYCQNYQVKQFIKNNFSLNGVKIEVNKDIFF